MKIKVKITKHMVEEGFKQLSMLRTGHLGNFDSTEELNELMRAIESAVQECPIKGCEHNQTIEIGPFCDQHMTEYC